ncbi:hypothetical protein [uncultured Alsobacter sp.]|uniref:hypothetical protein n=1 Tax=uncultured Alsobacter sp. TaxID=1748258 RepID=UPI0025E8ED84|nr:hypothetical protein [uncultured Alsobacter sp.]
MATIPLITPDESGVTAAAMTATATGGDAFSCPNDTGDYVFLFRNDHSAGIDVSMVSQLTNKVVQGVGKVSKANQTKTVAANGGICAFKLSRNEISAYLDNSGLVNFSYASWNAALKVVGMKVPA